MATSSITINFRTYLWTLSGAIVLLLSGIITLNYVVDPYLIHQWDSPLVNRLYPGWQKLTPWVKTYAASRYKPEVIYLGSSRAEVGLPTQVDLFSGKRVFSLTLSGGSLGDAMAMLKHTRVFNQPEIVVWGLDYGYLFSEGVSNTDFDRDLVAQGQFYPLWRTLLNFKRSMSMDITSETIAVLRGTSEQACVSTLTVFGQRPSPCKDYTMAIEGGTAKAFESVMKGNSGEEKPNFDTTLQQLDSVINDFCRQDTAFRFFIQPIHALDELYHSKPWQHMENWKRALVKIIDKHKQSGCDIRLMDFSGFNSITTEEIPQATGKPSMQNYWEQSHYRPEVGKKMLFKLFSSTPQDVKNDFGVDLNAAVIEAHLANVRQARDNYCATHSKETALLECE